MKCRDCKWFEKSRWMNPLTNELRDCYVCTCKNKRRWHQSRFTGYQIMEPSHAACKSGFKPKEK